MNTEQVAALLGLTPGRIRQLARAYRDTGDGLRGQQIGGRDWLFLKEDVEEFAGRPRPLGRPPKHK